MAAQVPLVGVDVEAIVGVLKAIADPTRFQVVWAVSEGERPVGELAEMVGAHVAAVSQHLAKLRAAGLVTSRRDGTRIYYRAANAHLHRLLEEAGLLTGYLTGVIDPPDHGSGGAPAKEATAQVEVPVARTRRTGAVSRLRPARG